ncbi:hypothetical protein ANN_10854 [Periplaneta americana]|uniref:Uncharacterized protein n=1 Tax=Periplaneta americana TaxID=6978 RepID=A0ABQ8T545_PERAM|nr:hypothetical protein ANN_10854 [Periplaneta americana]
MPQRRQLDPVLKGRIIGRLEAGQTQTEVFSNAESVISRLWRWFEDTGDVRHMPVQSCLFTTPQEDRYLTLIARCNRTMPARQLSSELAAASDVRFPGKLYTGGSGQAVSVPDDQQCVSSS